MKRKLSIIIVLVLVLTASPLFILNGVYAAGDGVFQIEITNKDGAVIYKDEDQNSETFDEIIPYGTVAEVERIFAGDGIQWAELDYEGIHGFVLIRGADGQGDARNADTVEYNYIITDKNGVGFYQEDSISADQYDEKIPYNEIVTVRRLSDEYVNEISYQFGEIEYDGKTGYIAIRRFDTDGKETTLGVEFYDDYVAKRESTKKVIIAVVIIAVVLVVAAVVAVLLIKKKKSTKAKDNNG